MELPDPFDVVMGLAIGGLTLLTIIAVIGTFHVMHNCEATDETRIASRMRLAGKVPISTPVQERRYVCPDGLEVWL